MKLYFSPLACSMATRIALYEAGADARYANLIFSLKQTGAPLGGLLAGFVIPPMVAALKPSATASMSSSHQKSTH